MSGSIDEHKPPTVDHATLDTLRELMGAGFPDLIKVFLAAVPQRLTAMREAARSGESQALLREVHTLKGSSANLGAVALSNLCKGLEESCRDGMPADALSRLEKIVEEYGHVESALRRETELPAEVASAGG